MTQSREWIGVDFDGTLVGYHGWKGPEFNKLGEPVWPMVRRVRAWLEEGKDVQIFTARVHPDNPNAVESEKTIREWCGLFLREVLPVRCDKDMMMIERLF